MFNDQIQLEKAKERRKIVRGYIGDKEIDNNSFTYFMDLVDDLSSCIDLKLGKIENIPNINTKIIDRMYSCGECLLTDDLDDVSKEYIDQYIDSVVVEYAKFGYEVGLNLFKEKLNEFTKKFFGNGIDYHDAIIYLTKQFSIDPFDNTKEKTISIA